MDVLYTLLTVTQYEVDEDIRTLGQQELPNDIPRSYGKPTCYESCANILNINKVNYPLCEPRH